MNKDELITVYLEKVQRLNKELSARLSCNRRDFVETRISFFEEVIKDLNTLPKEKDIKGISKDELITKQQLEIENYKVFFKDNKELIKDIKSRFYSIGQPLNDNCLEFNSKQLNWCFSVINLITQINSNIEEDGEE